MTSNRPKFLRPNANLSSVDKQDEIEIQYELHKFHTQDTTIDLQRKQLPIYRYKDHILYLMEQNRVLVLIGETGCGKSTQIPQYLMDNGWTNDNKMICIAEPRRIAAVNLATRVSDERSCVLGQEVGYAIRFENVLSEKTQIKYVTDGLLIREMMQNPLLPQYSVIILDEVHERGVNVDILMGLLKKIMRKRADLKLIVCSATMDAEEIKLYFDEATNKNNSVDHLSTEILSVEGRYFPVEIEYLSEPCDNYIKSSVSTALAIHLNQEQNDGDILIFLIGQDEVDEAVSRLVEQAQELNKEMQRRNSKKLWILPLYGSLPIAEQTKVFQRTPSNTRKVIVSTNVAETSLTISGVVFVIDCGFMRLKAYDSKLGAESLITVAISKSSANQRAGRAGRYRSGKAYRLYPEEEYLKLKEHTPPEMRRCDLAPVILQLKAMGIDNICIFDFISAPPANSLIDSLELLHALGALDSNAQLARPLGFQMAEFPLHATSSKALLTAHEFGCAQEVIAIVAMLQVQHIFVTPSGQKKTADKAKLKFSCVEGDHLTLLNVFRCFLEKLKTTNVNSIKNWCVQNYLNYRSLQRALQLRDQFVALLKKFHVNTNSTCGDRTEPILKCLTAAFVINVAKSHYSGDYKHLRSNKLLKIHPSSVLNLLLANTNEPLPKYVLYNDIVQSKSCQFIRDLSVIDCKWLHELVPDYYEYGTTRELNEKHLKAV